MKHAASDVWVGHAQLRVRASNAGAGVASLRVLEQALPEALSAVAGLPGDSVVVLRKVDLRLAARLSGDASKGALLSALRSHLKSRIREAMSQSAEISEDSAHFPSRPAALAAYVAALAEGSAQRWPFSSFAGYGATPLAVLRSCAEESLALAGDVLAGWSSRVGAHVVLQSLGDAEALELCGFWISPRGATELPSVVLARLKAAPQSELSETRRLLLGLLVGFELWPPLRGELVERSAILRPAASGLKQAAQPSSAGGLVFWALLLQQTGLMDELAAAYPHPRRRSAVLWALGRCLESPSIDARDPLLLWWCGESPDARMSPTQVLADSDPEPAHRIAVQVCVASGGAAEGVVIAPWGDGWIAMSRDVAIDFCLDGDVEQSLEAVVSRFKARAGEFPAGVALRSQATEGARHVLGTLDMPSIPDTWRPAVLALASVVAQKLRETYGANVADLRSWQASLTETGIVVKRSDAQRVKSGLWMPERVEWWDRGWGVEQ